MAAGGGAQGMDGAVGPPAQAVPLGEMQQDLLPEAEDVIDVLDLDVEEALEEAAVDGDRGDGVGAEGVGEDDGAGDLVAVARAVGEIKDFAGEGHGLCSILGRVLFYFGCVGVAGLGQDPFRSAGYIWATNPFEWSTKKTEHKHKLENTTLKKLLKKTQQVRSRVFLCSMAASGQNPEALRDLWRTMHERLVVLERQRLGMDVDRLPNIPEIRIVADVQSFIPWKDLYICSSAIRGNLQTKPMSDVLKLDKTSIDYWFLSKFIDTVKHPDFRRELLRPESFGYWLPVERQDVRAFRISVEMVRQGVDPRVTISAKADFYPSPDTINLQRLACTCSWNEIFNHLHYKKKLGDEIFLRGVVAQVPGQPLLLPRPPPPPPGEFDDGAPLMPRQRQDDSDDEDFEDGALMRPRRRY
jgi:hypothetical protein